MSNIKRRGKEIEKEKEILNKRYEDCNARFEQAMIMKERMANDMKIQKEVYDREVEILKQNDSNNRKMIEEMQTNYQKLLHELFELRVVRWLRTVQLRNRVRKDRELPARDQESPRKQQFGDEER